MRRKGWMGRDGWMDGWEGINEKGLMGRDGWDRMDEKGWVEREEIHEKG